LLALNTLFFMTMDAVLYVLIVLGSPSSVKRKPLQFCYDLIKLTRKTTEMLYSLR